VKQKRFHKLDVVWWGVLLLLLAAQFWFPNLGSGLSTDTWSNSARGKRAFYLFSSHRAPSVHRNYDAFESLLMELQWRSDWGDSQPVLCLLGPERYPTNKEWRIVLDWVAAGGRLVFATSADSEVYEIPGVDLATVEDPPSIDQVPSGGLPDIGNQLTEQQHEFAWREEYGVSGNDMEPLLMSDGTVQVARKTWGSGTIVFVSGDSIFTNQYLAYEENALLAWRIVEATGGVDEIVFDEYLNDSGTPKMVRILFEMPIRPLTLLTLVVVSLLLWRNSHRFGPLLPESLSPRRNIVDHTDMMGNQLWNSRAGSYALKLYLRQLIQELGLKQHRGQERRILEPIAWRMEVSIDSLIKLFKDAAKEARRGNCQASKAAELIERLSQVRAANYPRNK